MTDLSKLNFAEATNDPKWVTLYNKMTGEELKTEDGKPIRIKVLGAQSRKFREAYNEQTRKAQARRVPLPDTIENRERNSAELLASATVEWEGIIWEGAPLECTRENAEMLYRTLGWIREQVDNFVADEKNYWTGPKKS